MTGKEKLSRVTIAGYGVRLIRDARSDLLLFVPLSWTFRGNSRLIESHGTKKIMVSREPIATGTDWEPIAIADYAGNVELPRSHAVKYRERLNALTHRDPQPVRRLRQLGVMTHFKCL